MALTKEIKYETTNKIIKLIWFLAEFQVMLLIYKTKLHNNINTKFPI